MKRDDIFSAVLWLGYGIIVIGSMVIAGSVWHIATGQPRVEYQTHTEYQADQFGVGEWDKGIWYRIEPTRFHDADTLPRGDLYLGFGVVLKDQSFRVDDYDASEVDTTRERRNPKIKVTPEEIVNGKRAAKEFQELVASGELYCKPNKKRARDIYGRILCSFAVAKPNEGQFVHLSDYARSHGWLRAETFTLEDE